MNTQISQHPASSEDGTTMDGTPPPVVSGPSYRDAAASDSCPWVGMAGPSRHDHVEREGDGTTTTYHPGGRRDEAGADFLDELRWMSVQIFRLFIEIMDRACARQIFYC